MDKLRVTSVCMRKDWLLSALIVHARKFQFKVDDSVEWTDSRAIFQKKKEKKRRRVYDDEKILPFFMGYMQARNVFSCFR